MEYRVPDSKSGARGGEGFIFQNAHAYHAPSDIYPERDCLIDPYVATPPRNKLKNRSNRKEVLLKMEKTRLW